jgi:hypothetical protein
LVQDYRNVVLRKVGSNLGYTGRGADGLGGQLVTLVV